MRQVGWLDGLTDGPSLLSRREAVRRMALGAAGLSLLGRAALAQSPTDGRLRSRPTKPTSTQAPGLTPLGLGSDRDGFLYVPNAPSVTGPLPLALLFHGAGRRANELVMPMRQFADDVGLVLVSVDAREVTWQQRIEDFGPDIEFIDAALTSVYKKVNVDPSRIRCAGFSDGGSFSLSLGLLNGDLFTKVAAFSPGYVIPGKPVGKPKFLITHGTRDQILPIDVTSRRIVPRLRADGYDVDYREWDGPHAFSAPILKNAAEWVAAK